MAAQAYHTFDQPEDDYRPPFTLPVDKMDDPGTSVAENLTCSKRQLLLPLGVF